MPTKCQQNKKFAAMTICHGPLQYTTQRLSYQSKSNELREAREVFFQWLVDLYRRGFSIALIVHSLDRYPLRCWLVLRGSLAYSLFIRLIHSLAGQ